MISVVDVLIPQSLVDGILVSTAETCRLNEDGRRSERITSKTSMLVPQGVVKESILHSAEMLQNDGKGNSDLRNRSADTGERGQ